MKIIENDGLKKQLKNKLKELFQFENEDLNFGIITIYRIMNYKRKEIENFIEKELIDEIEKQSMSLSEEERKKIKGKLKEISSKNGVKKYLEALHKGDEGRGKIYREDFANLSPISCYPIAPTLWTSYLVSIYSFPSIIFIFFIY